MSATLRVADFADNKTLFPDPPPIINIAARQHPVTIHFNRRTSSDYVTEAVKKTSKIHSRLPPGGILVFLTGQNEITGACRMLEARYGENASDERRQRKANGTHWNVARRDMEFTRTPAQAQGKYLTCLAAVVISGGPSGCGSGGHGLGRCRTRFLGDRYRW